ncbi:phosphonate ABC transporter substrate-binding protein [Desulfoluna butyratoxydans]|uniref:Phosphonate abc transporter substrate-binding protein n=1 Tax=Desulfoluna butyratoxydans TaxID=231438 RepID=A0A4U8YMS6_9BACT|nr:phosphonate ABC transporter substrate-binding protein [Desulfoluna butyratoxydans]VFQ44837.1 phosphonate abc transporter substrate-binding protein [Desulfoluna butyratoxydans]
MFDNARRLTAVCVMCIGLILSGTASASQAQWPQKIRIGFIPTEGGSAVESRFQPLADHVKKSLGVEVEIISASDYSGVITAMAHKHLDFAYFGPKSYVEAAKKADAQAIALELNKAGEPGYYGVIITRKDSPIKTLSQIKGKVFAFTDPNSTSGYLVPNILFARDLKVKPEAYFRQVKFSGSHGASILSVKNGTVEVAATNNIDLDRMIQKGQATLDDFRVLWTSELIPGAPMAARKDLPESLKAAFAGALLSFNGDTEGMAHLQNGGYGFADDSTYDTIRYLKYLKKKMAAK